LLSHLVTTLADETEGGFADQVLVESLGTALLIRLVRHFVEHLPLPTSGGLSPERLRRVRDYVETHLDGDKFAHALHSSVHEREMICDRGSAVRGSMTSPDVRATRRAYVAGLERHKMEEWRTNAASGPRLEASSMTNRLYSSLDERRGSGHSQLHSQASLPAIS
jgi:hypothetical protein